MKASELRQKSKEELETILREKRSERGELEFGMRQKKVKNVKGIGTLRKDIARILTLIKNAN